MFIYLSWPPAPHILILTSLHIIFVYSFIYKTHLLSWGIIGSPICVVAHPTSILCLAFPFAILLPSLHSYDLIPLSSSATGRRLQHGKALISCITTFWINPVWTLWAAVAVSQGPRSPRTSQRTLTMTVYGRPTVTGWALFPVRAPTSPTKIKLPPHSSYFKWLYIYLKLFIY